LSPTPFDRDGSSTQVTIQAAPGYDSHARHHSPGDPLHSRASRSHHGTCEGDIDRTSLFACRRRISRAHGLGKCARNSAAFRRVTSFRFYARLHGRATVSLSQAQVIAAVEVLSLALRALHGRVSTRLSIALRRAARGDPRSGRQIHAVRRLHQRIRACALRRVQP